MVGMGQSTYHCVYGTMDSFSSWETTEHPQPRPCEANIVVCMLAWLRDKYLLSISHGLDQQRGDPGDTCISLPGSSFPDLTLYSSLPTVVQPHSLAVPRVSPHPMFCISCPLCQEHPPNILLPSTVPKTLCQVDSYSSCRTQSSVS